jgi:hypothetical protein
LFRRRILRSRNARPGWLIRDFFLTQGVVPSCRAQACWLAKLAEASSQRSIPLEAQRAYR